MVVPLVDLGHAGGEGAQVLVEQVVGELASVLVERLSDLQLLRGDHVAPGAPAWQRDGLLQRPVGVDGVTAAHEEVGLQGLHRREDAVAAELGVDAPALPGEVAAPGERHVAPAARGGAQRPVERLAEQARLVEVFQRHAVEGLLARRQRVEEHLAGEVGVRREHRALDAPGAAEGRRARDVDEHPARPIGSAPDDAGLGRHIAGLDAVRQRGARADERRGAAGGDDERGARDGARAQELTATEPRGVDMAETIARSRHPSGDDRVKDALRAPHVRPTCKTR